MSFFLEAMLNGWWQGILLTLVVWAVLREVRRINAATRLAIWQVTLLFVLLLPALQYVPVALRPTAHRQAAPTKSIQHSSLAEPLSSSIKQIPFRKPVIEFSDHEWPTFLLIFSTALAFLQLLRLLLGYSALWRLKRKALPIQLGLPVRLSRSTRVLMSDKIGMPVAAGYLRPAILLPQYLMDHLTPEEVQYVLLHESAHLNRYDDWAVLGERLIGAIFCFQPAVHWIGRQMNREREVACDDWVIAQSGQVKPYASSLARLAELGSSGQAPALAMGAGKSKQIFARLELLFDGARNRVPVVSKPVVILASLLLLLAIFKGTQFSHLLGLSNFSNRWIESDGTSKREFKLRGNVVFSPDDQDVQSMSPGAMLVVEQSDEFRTWRIEFEPDQEGTIQRRYFAGRTQRPFDSEARSLLNLTLPRWVRELGRNIPERLSRSIRDKGVYGALEDIRSIRSNNVKRAYLEELFQQIHLDAKESSRALKIAGGLDSDDDKRRLLESFYDRNIDRDQRLGNPNLELPTLELIDSIHSDEDRAKLLTQFIDRGPVSEISIARVLRSVAEMSSDSAKTDLLLRVSETPNASITTAFFEAASTIHSDNDRERLLSKILAEHAGNPEIIAQVLRTALSLNSDNEKTKILIACASRFHGERETLVAASRVLTSIHSDGDRRRALETFIAADGRNNETLNEILSQTSKLDSDEDKSHLLLQMAATFIEQEPVRNAFFSAVTTLRSSGDQRRVLLAVLARSNLSPESLHEVTKAALQMSALEDQAAVLRVLAARA